MSLTGRAPFAAKATQNFRTTCATLISSSGEYCCSTKHTRPRSTAIFGSLEQLLRRCLCATRDQLEEKFHC